MLNAKVNVDADRSLSASEIATRQSLSFYAPSVQRPRSNMQMLCCDKKEKMVVQGVGVYTKWS